jgi:hypothetical protein
MSLPRPAPYGPLDGERPLKGWVEELAIGRGSRLLCGLARSLYLIIAPNSPGSDDRDTDILRVVGIQWAIWVVAAREIPGKKRDQAGENVIPTVRRVSFTRIQLFSRAMLRDRSRLLSARATGPYAPGATNGSCRCVNTNNL